MIRNYVLEVKEIKLLYKLYYFQRQQLVKPTKIGILNSQPIGNQFTEISDGVTSNGCSFFAAVETRHNSDYCPNLIACTPSGYRCIEKARSRSAMDVVNIRTNHDGVCLFFKACYALRREQLPSHKSMELLAVHVHGASVILLFIIIYRPRSLAVNSVFFDDIVEQVAVFAAPPVIVWD